MRTNRIAVLGPCSNGDRSSSLPPSPLLPPLTLIAPTPTRLQLESCAWRTLTPPTATPLLASPSPFGGEADCWGWSLVRDSAYYPSTMESQRHYPSLTSSLYPLNARGFPLSLVLYMKLYTIIQSYTCITIQHVMQSMQSM